MTSRFAPVVGFLSGKGGVGKTNVAANIAVASRGLGAEVLPVDGDLGLANLDTLLGLTPTLTSADVLEGSCSLDDAIVEGPRGIHVLPATRGQRGLASRRPHQLIDLMLPLYTTSERYDLVLLDVGPGVGETSIGLSACCDLAVLVTTPEPTSLVDAYAMLKILSREAPELPVEVLVNGSRNDGEARRVHEHLQQIAERFLDLSPACLGNVPADTRLVEAVRLQRSVVETFPMSRSSRGLVRIAEDLLRRETRPRHYGADPGASLDYTLGQSDAIPG